MSTFFTGAQGLTGQSIHQPELKGYVIIGNSVITLPAQLREGDWIVFTGINGTQVYNQRVNNGYFKINVSRLPAGFYILSLMRNGVKIATARVPLKTV